MTECKEKTFQSKDAAQTLMVYSKQVQTNITHAYGDGDGLRITEKKSWLNILSKSISRMPMVCLHTFGIHTFGIHTFGIHTFSIHVEASLSNWLVYKLTS